MVEVSSNFSPSPQSEVERFSSMDEHYKMYKAGEIDKQRLIDALMMMCDQDEFNLVMQNLGLQDDASYIDLS